ncbi:uncharacterized protein LOC144988889 isoform X3 [Oryzias latipes]
MCSGRSRLPLRCASNSHLCSSRLHVAPILTRKIQKVCSRTSFGASVGKEDWRWRPTVLLGTASVSRQLDWATLLKRCMDSSMEHAHMHKGLSTLCLLVATW